MVCLNEHQVKEVKELIEGKGSTMEELTNDLLDHICCMIEEKLESKKDYKLALQETMAVFGNSGIRTIQEETTFLLTKNILAMKKTTNIIGIAAVALLLLGAFFKIRHLAGAGVIYISGAFLLSFIFLPMLLTIKLKQKVSKLHNWMYIVGTVGGMALSTGILFKIMHWPFASMLMTIGGILAVFVFLPLYIAIFYRKKDMRSNTIVTSVLLIGTMCMLFLLVRVYNSKIVNDSIINIQYTIYEETTDVDNLNLSLYAELQSDSIKKQHLNATIAKIEAIDAMVNNLIMDLCKSGHDKLSEAELEVILAKNYSQISDDSGHLEVLRSGEVTLAKLLAEVAAYEKLVQSALGATAKLTLNDDNFETYNSEEFNKFPLGIVVVDLTTLNLQVKKMQTSLLHYYKGKVS